MNSDNYRDAEHEPSFNRNGGKRSMGKNYTKDLWDESWLRVSKHNGNKVKKKRRFRK